MANSTYEILETHTRITNDWSELYVRISNPTDFLAIGGWYKKIIPPSLPAQDALTKALGDGSYLNWDRGAPY